MSGDKRARLKQLLDSAEIALQPLTFPQRELWEASPVPVGDMANHICCLIHIRGAIAPEDSRAAIQRVVERQDALRVSFLPGKDRAVQMVRRSGDASPSRRVCCRRPRNDGASQHPENRDRSKCPAHQYNHRFEN